MSFATVTITGATAASGLQANMLYRAHDSGSGVYVYVQNNTSLPVDGTFADLLAQAAFAGFRELPVVSGTNNYFNPAQIERVVVDNANSARSYIKFTPGAGIADINIDDTVANVITALNS